MDLISLMARSRAELEPLLARTLALAPEGIEIRLDHVDLPRRELERLRGAYPGFLLAASRAGGRIDALELALGCGFDAVDVDARRRDFLQTHRRLGHVRPGALRIVSWHDDAGVPGAAALERLRERLSCWGLVKLAVTPRGRHELRRVWRAAAGWRAAGRRFILTTMGPLGAAGRLRLRGLGNEINYFAVDLAHATAPGQLAWRGIDQRIERSGAARA